LARVLQLLAGPTRQPHQNDVGHGPGVYKRAWIPLPFLKSRSAHRNRCGSNYEPKRAGIIYRPSYTSTRFKHCSCV